MEQGARGRLPQGQARGAARRLLPDQPLPPYAFVPGRFPHPESDPAGHSFGVARGAAAFDPDDWAACAAYLRGLDLFNAGFYWECHVEFERLWMACGRRGPLADFFKGCIKLAAAGVKHREGVAAGVASHAAGAARLWQGVAEARGGEPPVLLGFALGELTRLAQSIRRHGWPEPCPVLVPRLPDDPP